MRKTLVLLALFGLATMPIRADDLNPAPWRGVAPTYTFQEWTFVTGGNPTPPDVVANPYGTPSATITGGTWNVDGWNLLGGGSIDFNVPNAPVDLEKDIWVQVTYQLVGPNPLTISASAGMSYDVGHLENVMPMPPWTHATYSMTLFPNPTSEIITLGGDVLIGQVVIETQCVPEPGTLAFMGLGVGLLLLRRKK